MLKTLLGSSPRTTIIGYLTAIGTVIIPIIQDESFDIHKHWKSLLIAIAIALYSRVTKDSNGIHRNEDVVVAKIATDGIIPPKDDEKVL